MIGSMPSRRAMPAATPPITPRSGSRRSGIAADALIIAIFAASIVVAGRLLQPGGEEDRPDRREQERCGVAEPQVDRIDLVEQQDEAAGDGDHPRDERCPVDPSLAHLVPPSQSETPSLTWLPSENRRPSWENWSRR